MSTVAPDLEREVRCNCGHRSRSTDLGVLLVSAEAHLRFAHKMVATEIDLISMLVPNKEAYRVDPPSSLRLGARYPLAF